MLVEARVSYGGAEVRLALVEGVSESAETGVVGLAG